MSVSDPIESPLTRALRLPFRLIRGLYEWTIRWADHRHSVFALVMLSFMEASFFPIPPDLLLMALAFAKPHRAFWFAGLCTLASVSGGVFGWLIGSALWSALGTDPVCPDFGGGGWLFANVPGFHCESFGHVQALYRDNAWLALFSAAFTPIPFKIFTVASGVFSVPILTLVLASLLGRGGRFFMVAALIHWFGPAIRSKIEARFEWWTLGFAALLALGVFAVKWLL